jgi:hypothetical protein
MKHIRIRCLDETSTLYHINILFSYCERGIVAHLSIYLFFLDLQIQHKFNFFIRVNSIQIYPF